MKTSRFDRRVTAHLVANGAPDPGEGMFYRIVPLYGDIFCVELHRKRVLFSKMVAYSAILRKPTMDNLVSAAAEVYGHVRNDR